MITYSVQIYIIDGEKVAPKKSKSFRITAEDIDGAKTKVKREIFVRELPPIRAMNFGPGKNGECNIHVYCSYAQKKADVIEGLTEWQQPPGRGQI